MGKNKFKYDPHLKIVLSQEVHDPNESPMEGDKEDCHAGE